MKMNETPVSERLHIGFFGKRNAGKSSLVNAVTGQLTAVVSDVKGTTTDPVSKTMELLPAGPVVIIDTPGYDDEGELGQLRVKRTEEILRKTDIAVLVTDATEPDDECVSELVELFKAGSVPYIIAYNKADIAGNEIAAVDYENVIKLSALTGEGVHELKEMIGRISTGLNVQREAKMLVADLVSPGDVVIQVIPIDSSAPKGRIILPQQQVLRELLERGVISVVVRETELEAAIKNSAVRPALVITDSQAFHIVSKIVPEDIPLTSYSILMARYKGFYEAAVKSVHAIEQLKEGDKVLISEGCTHHRQCEDIGTVKIPAWLKSHTGAGIEIETSSGKGFPEDLSSYKLIIHCGGCMLNEKEVVFRRDRAAAAGVPFINYGILIAYMNGILARSTKML